MKIITVIFLLSFAGNLKAQSIPPDFLYLDPIPNAKLVNKETTIIIRPGASINTESFYSKNTITLYGSKSGEHSYQILKSDDNTVIILKPLQIFTKAETVYVRLNNGIKKINGTSIKPFSYEFYISKFETNRDTLDSVSRDLWETDFGPDTRETYQSSLFLNEPPPITVTYSHFPSLGKIFMCNITPNPSFPNTPYLLIIDNKGKPVFSRQMEKECYDFNIQPNGMLTYYDKNMGKFYGMDQNYNIIDSFYCGNGYSTDLHELRLLNNGHALMMSYDAKTIDSGSGIGDRIYTIIGLIVQETDKNKNVVFQWRSWDHFQITDATHENLTATRIDYVHGNAIEMDNDGHIMISSRHMDEVTKINRTTGDIIWRLGGKNNQFQFINDNIRFSYQHAIRRIKNGNITLYDNGNYHEPPFSRAIEYKLDEVNKIASLVWQYRNNPDIYGRATGYVQRLDNNNTIICWGLTNPTFCEVRYDGTKVLEMTFPPRMFTYRAYRYEWKESGNDKLVPETFRLRQNFPNPFNPSTNIKFEIPKSEPENSYTRAIIVLYDILGRNMGTILDESFPAGTYSINFDAGKFSSGVYFFTLTAGNYSETKKMVLIK